jgi:hypothetical protein
MSTPDKVETDALGTCGLLLRYAAQSISTTEQKTAFAAVVADIQATWDAVQQNQWSPAVGTKFWVAYNNLCILINPVSSDTLATSTTTVSYSRWWLARQFGRPPLVLTLPQIAVRRYIVLFVVLLALSVGLSFLTATISTTNAEIKNLIKIADPLAEEITLGLSALRAKNIGDNDDFTVTADNIVQVEAGKITTALSKLYSISDQLYGKAASTKIILFEKYPVCKEQQNQDDYFCYEMGKGGTAKAIANAQANVDNYHLTARRAYALADRSQDRANFIKSTILPLLLGMTGACAYVVRLMSEQIRTSSFSSTSSIRHFVRITLGALAGFAVGFGGIVGDASLTTGALSFLAGYAIEPVFATFDSIAEKFRH